MNIVSTDEHLWLYSRIRLYATTREPQKSCIYPLEKQWLTANWEPGKSCIYTKVAYKRVAYIRILLYPYSTVSVFYCIRILLYPCCIYPDSTVPFIPSQLNR